MKTKHYLLFSILLMIVLSSCSDFTGSKDNINIDTNIYRGTQGVSLVFSDKNFQETLVDKQRFLYEVKVQNNGPYPANGLLLVSFVQGVITTDASNSYYSAPVSLRGKTPLDQTNDYTIPSFSAIANKPGLTEESEDTTIRTSLCYNYEGLATTEVCIDTQTLETENQPGCSNVNSNLGGGQGGPVAITSIETKMIRSGSSLLPKFKITIQNMGQGKVIAYGEPDRICRGQGITENDYDVVSLKDITFSRFGMSDFECNPLDLKLKEGGENYITCILRDGRSIDTSGPSYKSYVTVKLLYGYKITDTRTVLIEHRIEKT
jgi:hypothetical protein